MNVRNGGDKRFEVEKKQCRGERKENIFFAFQLVFVSHSERTLEPIIHLQKDCI